MKNLIVALLITIMAYAPFGTVMAQQPSADEMFNELTATLLAIGQAITTSTTLTDDESLALMTQLITVSNSIVSLRETYRLRGLVSSPLPVSEEDKISAEEAELERIIVAYDSDTEVIDVTMRFSTTTLERTYNFTALPTTAAYGDKLSRVITDMQTQLSDLTGVLQDDVEDIMFVTSWNPLRDTTRIEQNSSFARQLAENFAQFSIIDQIELRPADNSGVLEFSTDQDETLRLTLQRNLDEDGTFLRSYTYLIQFFFPSDLAPIATTGGLFDEQPVEVAQYEDTNRDVAEEEVLDFVIGLFTDVPFTRAISDFDGRLMRFLTRNSAYYSASIPSVSNPEVLDCYRSTDKVVVTKFIEFLAQGIDAQFEDVEDIIDYRAPILSDESTSGDGCRQTARFF